MSFLYDAAKDFACPLVGLAATYVARRAIHENQKIAGRRATLDMISHLAQDENYKKSRKLVVVMRRQKVDSGSLLADARREDGLPEEKAKRRERFEAAQYVLGKLAIYANGIKNGALDEESFKQYYFSSYLEIVSSLMGLIKAIREEAKKDIQQPKLVDPDTLYSELVWLLLRWQQDPLRVEKVPEQPWYVRQR